MSLTVDLGLNFADAEEKGKIKPMTEGDYQAQIVEVVDTDKDGNPLVTSSAKNPGLPMLKAKLTIVNDPEFTNRSLYQYFVICQEDWALRNITDIFKAAGVTWEGTSPDFSQLVGKTVNIRIGIGEYNGEPTNEIKKIF